MKIEKAELIEKNKQLEAIQKELEKNLEFEKESRLCHLEAIRVCEDWCFTNQVECNGLCKVLLLWTGEDNSLECFEIHLSCEVLMLEIKIL